MKGLSAELLVEMSSVVMGGRLSSTVVEKCSVVKVKVVVKVLHEELKSSQE